MNFYLTVQSPAMLISTLATSCHNQSTSKIWIRKAYNAFVYIVRDRFRNRKPTDNIFNSMKCMKEKELDDKFYFFGDFLKSET